MNLSTVRERIPGWFAAGKCIYLKSQPGRGKTTTMEEAPKRLSKLLGKNLGFVLINVPLLTPANSIGYLRHLPQERVGLAHHPAG